MHLNVYFLFREVNDDDLSQEELHKIFDKYEQLKKPEKKPETRHIETR